MNILSKHLPKAGLRWLVLAGMAAAAMPVNLSIAAPQSEPYVFKPEPGKGPILTVQAFADREAIALGEPFNVLISVKMEAGWHVYWANPGEGGLPTRIEWKLPKGFEVGSTKFPFPEVYVLKGEGGFQETGYVLGETAALVTPIKPSKDLKPGESIRIDATVSWLACKSSCIPGQATLSLSLPVVDAPPKAKPANVALFEDAATTFPFPAAKAKHIKLSARTDPPVAKPGAKIAALIDVEIAPKMHMQSHKPLEEFLIPAYVFIEREEGVELGDVEYPKAHERVDKVLGKLSEYAGKVTFKVPIEVAADAGTRPRVLRGVLQYQICEDTGTCFAPERVGFEIPVRMEGGPPPASSEWQSAGSVGVPARPASDSDASISPATSADEAPVDDRNFLFRFQDWLMGLGYAGALAAAFIGGLLLNLMPCVLPVLSLKILSFVRQSHESRGRVFALGLVYCAGIMTFFGVLAALFAWSGTGWGQLFQSPTFVIIVAGVVTAFALSLFGVFTIFTPRVVSNLDEKVQGEGFVSAYATGLLATLLGTACTAPFLTAAIGAASKVSISHGPAYAGAIFLAAGFGMALPFLILAANPALMKFVPKAGPWMITFEGVMGFVLLFTVIWLLNPLRAQIGDFGVLITLFFLVMVGMAAWVKGKVQYGDSAGRKLALNLLVLALVATGWLLPFRVFSTIGGLVSEKMEQNTIFAVGQDCIRDQESQPDRVAGDRYGNIWDTLRQGHTIPWQPYYRQRALEAVDRGYTVFVDYTASWCASCKANLAFITSAPSVKTMRELRIIPFEADFTLGSREVEEDLKKYGRAGVPMYLVYKPGDPENPQVLDALTTGILVNAFKKAGASKVKPATDAMADARETRSEPRP
ncbi:MAG TPA: protein-disulfide reductase DsbD domain-containing protein [Phycisphaerae bacterium]|nr:protein-disulfide reductase DsbD domain-containing protein [Phycisphaerae bacterium]